MAAARHRRPNTPNMTALLRRIRHVVAWAEPWDWDTDDD
jgi:hypothetical protein